MTQPNSNYVVCPYCGREYLPAEIFMPDSFLGEPKNIIKDENGKILSFSNSSMNLKEEYTCDECGNTFQVEAAVKFKTIQKQSLFDDDAYTVSITSDNTD